LVWKIETNLPPFPHYKLGDTQYYDELKDWFYLLGDKKKFNGIVSISKENDSLLQCFIGSRDTELKQTIGIHTRFRLASVSKQFTAVGVMVLLKKFQIEKRYDHLVTDILPKFPYPDVTIRHLLNHTSGIDVDYIALANKKFKGNKKTLTIQHALDLICNTHVKFSIPPQTKFIYNNTNYVLLAAIIELVSGLSFEEFMHREVFEPLELNDTMVWNLASKKSIKELDNVAIDFEQYLGSKPRLIEPTWIDGVAGDGGIFSSFDDLKKWMNILESNKLFSKDEMQVVFQKPVLDNGNASEYGFGWVIEDNFIWHDGKWLATNSCIIKDRDRNIILIVIDNASNLRFDKIIYLVKEQIFKTI
jgi:CubicO group peptidase (beta-lactamase class C family)